MGTRPIPGGRHSLPGRLLRSGLVRLGPVPVKFGQVLGTRVDLVAEPIRRELTQLHDRVPPPPLHATQATLRAGLGPVADNLLLDPIPIGSGSVAVVHRARLRGDELAVKVRRPGVVHTVHRDVTVLRAGARLLSVLPGLRGLPVRAVVDQVADGIIDQTDFNQEAAHLRALAATADIWGVHVPQPVPELSTSAVLTTPYLAGLSPAEWGRTATQTRHRAVETTMNFVYDALFGSGLVHADLHPGNLYLRAGQVVVLDGGLIYQLSEFARRSFLAFFLAFATGDGPTCAAIVWNSAARRRGAPGHERDFREAMTALIARHSGRAAEDFSLIEFSTHLFDLQRRFGLTASPEFALPVLALLVVEGTVRAHHPTLNFQQLAVPHLLRATFRLEPSAQFGDTIWKAS